MQKHLTLVDLIALLFVREEKHACAAVSFKLPKTSTHSIDIIFFMNKPASDVTTEFAEAAKHIPNRLLQKKISAPEARLELSRLVFVHCQAKMSGWYNKFIAALSTIPPEDTFSLIILQSRLRVASRPLWAAIGACL
jgi:hypothetical protein